MRYFFRVSSDVFQGFSKSRGGFLGRAKRSDISQSILNYNPMVIKRGNGKTYVYIYFYMRSHKNMEIHIISYYNQT